MRSEIKSSAALLQQRKKTKTTYPSLRILLVSSSALLFVSVKMSDLFSASPMISSSSFISLAKVNKCVLHKATKVGHSHIQIVLMHTILKKVNHFLTVIYIILLNLIFKHQWCFGFHQSSFQRQELTQNHGCRKSLDVWHNLPISIFGSHGTVILDCTMQCVA